MSMSNIFAKPFQLTAIATALALAGCGSGGNDTLPQNPTNTTSTSTSTSGSTDTSNSTDTTTTNLKISAISLTDIADGKNTTTISNLGAKATVKVTNASGEPVSSAIVTFSGDGVTFGTSNGAVLTNAEGEASISVKPANITNTGAYSLSATANYKDETVTSASYNYTLQAVNVAIANMKADTNNLPSGGSTNITLTTQNSTTNSALNDILVNFSTTCGTFTSNAVTSINGGNVTTTYKGISADGKLCEGNQTITATTATGGITQTIPVTIENIQANSLIYTTDKNVSLLSTNSGTNTSEAIEFTVYSNGVVVADKEVDITLVQAPSDLSLSSTNTTTKTVRLKSDSSGKVSVRLYPGSIPGPVEVRATLTSNPAISTTSKNVTVTTGRVSQNGVSISLSKNSLQNNVDGDSATVTVRLTDRVGNNVPDGTVLNFVSEGGKITGYCATQEGNCTTTLTVQNPRPVDGRVTVLAYVEGDKAFTDVNGDNIWNNNEPFLNNIGDFFRDDNEDGQYNNGEFLYKRGETGSCGTSTVQPNIPNTCGTGLDAVLRQQFIVYFADESPTIVGLTNPLAISSSVSFELYGNSARTTPMPSGTTVSVLGVDNTKNNNASCTIEMRSGWVTVPAIADHINTPKYSVKMKECDVGDEMKLSIKTPNGGPQDYFYTLQ